MFSLARCAGNDHFDFKKFTRHWKPEKTVKKVKHIKNMISVTPTTYRLFFLCSLENAHSDCVKLHPSTLGTRGFVPQLVPFIGRNRISPGRSLKKEFILITI